MAIRINNMNELSKALMPTMKSMVDKLANEVYETLNYFLKEYYDSYNPVYYRRQYDFLHSAIKVDARCLKGDKIMAVVYIDTDSMNNYYNATGVDVVTWANEGLHGGLKTGNDTPMVWNDTLKETFENGELLRGAIEFLRRRGFEVKEGGL